MKLEISQHIFEKFTNVKFNENRSGGDPAVPCGGLTERQTDGQT